MLIEERVTTVEEALVHYMQVQERELSMIRESVAEIHASAAGIRSEVAEIRASNARTDRQLLEMQRQAEKDREQVEKNRQQAEKDRPQVEKNRQRADKALQQAVQQAEKDRHQVEKDRQRAEKDRKDFSPSKVLVVEAKWRLNPARVADYQQKLAPFFEFFPEYAGKALCPAVASVYLEPSIIVFLNREKIYGIAMGDEVMEVVNLGQF